MQVEIPFHAIPTLSSLTAEDRNALGPLCQVRGYEKSEAIFREGEPAHRIHFLYLGRVKIVKAAGDRDVIIEIIGPGEPIGNVAVFQQLPFPASAITLEPSSVLSIPEGEFFRLIESRPQITRALLAGLTSRLMAVNRRIADMTGSVEDRTARLFLTLASKLGQEKKEGIFIGLPLSRQEIADLVGTTIETSIRTMSRWQKEGIVRTEKDGFLIGELEALRERTSQT